MLTHAMILTAALTATGAPGEHAAEPLVAQGHRGQLVVDVTQLSPAESHAVFALASAYGGCDGIDCTLPNADARIPGRFKRSHYTVVTADGHRRVRVRGFGAVEGPSAMHLQVVLDAPAPDGYLTLAFADPPDASVRLRPVRARPAAVDLVIDAARSDLRFAVDLDADGVDEYLVQERWDESWLIKLVRYDALRGEYRSRVLSGEGD